MAKDSSRRPSSARLHVRYLCALLVAATLNTGCAVIIRGTRQEVAVKCDDPTAVVTVDGEAREPGTWALTRGEDHILVADSPGFKQFRKTIKSSPNRGGCFAYTLVVYVGCIVLVGLPLLVPFLIDSISGSLNDLEPEFVYVYFQPEDPPTPRAPSPSNGPPSGSHPELTCRQCGNAIVGAERFCSQCGAPVAPTAPQKLCPFCGEPRANASVRCPHCGQK